MDRKDTRDNGKREESPDSFTDGTWLHAQARRMIGRGARRHLESTDLAQEALLREHGKAGSNRFENRSARRGWLVRTMRNFLVSLHRRRSPFEWTEEQTSLQADQDSPSSAARKVDDDRYACSLLNVLSVRDRKVVRMRFENEPFSRISAALGVSESHARVIFQRSIHSMKRKADGDELRP
jgi:RNA polymerase sigma factor (sigma-70 family)